MRFAVLIVALIAVVAADDSLVTVAQGTLRGNIGKKSRSFLGVPFAAPPVGPLRWKPPAPAADWTGVRNATWYGNSCMQHSNAFTLFTGISEDCLVLNVYGPYPLPAKPLPVMIFFYGGSWETGSASFLLYNPDNDIALSDDVIFVTVNYRLNSFGFVAANALRAEDPAGGVGNYGFQDQQAAMRWVKTNIAAFGGDPNVVTIFGESAGAGSVSNHLVSPQSQGLFHRAAMESGPVADWSAQSFNTSQEKFIHLAHNTGCCRTSVCDSAAVLACMRALNETAIEDATHGLASGFLTWSPVVDGVTVLDFPEKLAAAGKIANVPLLFGTNHDEGTLFTKAPDDLSAADYPAYVKGRYGATLGAEVVKQYPATSYKSPFWACSGALGDSQMTCAARRTADWAVATRTAADPGVFVYFYTHVLDIIALVAKDVRPLGVFHGSELVMVFDFEDVLVTTAEQDLAKAFVKYWTNFAVYGNPNGAPSAPSTFPEWPAWNTTTRLTAQLDTGSILTPVADLKKDLCDFWDGVTVPKSIIFGT